MFKSELEVPLLFIITVYWISRERRVYVGRGYRL